MNTTETWSKLFAKSSFFSINKKEDLDFELENIQSKIIYDKKVDGFHPNRKSEFLLGRVCASKAFELCTGQELLSLPVNVDRSPEWPTNVVGTISHNQYWVGAAVAKSTDLTGLGMDFEVLGRTKLELAKQIRTPHDILKHPKLTDEELLTVIFSCKESLYKALYPSVKKFFGFEDAAVLEIDLDNGVFKIELLTQLSLKFGISSHKSFTGGIALDDKNCLTVLEV
jgi:enterobactin synthetase component D